MSKDEISIILVHGTWARAWNRLPKKLIWSDPESPFARKLYLSLKKSGVDSSIESFDWTGKNSIFARRVAADGLIKRIEALKAKGVSNIFVIGHSHGGNVALMTADKISNNGERLFIVTMATPFLRLFNVELSSPLAKSYLRILKSVFLLYYCALMLYFMFLLESPVIGALIGAVLSFLVFAATAKLFDADILPAPDEPRSDKKAKLLESCNYSRNLDSISEIMILRGVNDEASLALVGGLIINRVSGVLATIGGNASSFVFFNLFGILIIYLLAFVLILTNSDVSLPSSNVLYSIINAARYTIFYSTWGAVVLLMSIVAISPLLLIIMSASKGFSGRELIIGCGLIDVSVESAPDLGCPTTIKTLERDQSGLRNFNHSLYEHQDCEIYIGSWIAGKMGVSDAYNRIIITRVSSTDNELQEE